MTSVHRLILFTVLSAMELPSRPGSAQQAANVPLADNSNAMVRLEPHEKQSQFKLGDPVTLDLVFTAKSPGYAVHRDTNQFNAPMDLVDVTPAAGWFRAVGNQRGGSPEDLGAEPVRIPVLVSRSIVFQQPGHYEIRITTSRLVPSMKGVPYPPSGACCHPVAWSETTEAVGIDILPRDEHEESILVAQLSSILEHKPQQALSGDWRKQNEPLLNELTNQLKTQPANPARMLEVVGKVRAAQAEDIARFDRQTASRRNEAIRLSYLQGDDAIRAKVHWLLAGTGEGSDDTPAIMLNGFAHSRNLQLQLDLLQAAWTDTKLVPTGLLQSGLQQTKAFLNHETFELYYSHGVPGRTLPHTEAVAEYRRELSELIPTLPQRAGQNREQTEFYLLMGSSVLSPSDAARIHAEIEAEFAGLSPGMQNTLLGMRRKELCDPALLVPSGALQSACAATREPGSEAPAK